MFGLFYSLWFFVYCSPSFFNPFRNHPHCFCTSRWVTEHQAFTLPTKDPSTIQHLHGINRNYWLCTMRVSKSSKEIHKEKHIYLWIKHKYILQIIKNRLERGLHIDPSASLTQWHVFTSNGTFFPEVSSKMLLKVEIKMKAIGSEPWC